VTPDCLHRRRLLLASLLALPALAWADERGDAPAVGEDDVSVEYRGGTYFSRATFTAPVPQTVAWEVLTDFEHMADFVPNLESSKILSREGNIWRVGQQGRADFGPFSFRFESERRIELQPRQLILARALSGSAKYMTSEMRLGREGGNTTFDYRTEMIPERWIPSSLGVNLLRHEMAEQLSAMVREMMRRAGNKAAR